MKKNKIYGFLQSWIPVLILLLYPLRKVNTGIDLEAGNLSGECAGCVVHEASIRRYMDWNECVYVTSCGYHGSRSLPCVKEKAAASVSDMAWRAACIVPVLGAIYESVSVSGVLSDDGSSTAALSCSD